MKIRTGFVSNSSSSSFVIIGRRVTPAQLVNGNYNKKNLWVEGKGFGEGKDIFDLTREMIDLAIKNDWDIGEIDGVYEAYETIWEDGDLHPDQWPKDQPAHLYVFEKSMHSTSTLDEFRSIYIGGEDDN